jgi:hypothetical protein
MTGHPLWAFAHALRRTLASQDTAEVAANLHDDID